MADETFNTEKNSINKFRSIDIDTEIEFLQWEKELLEEIGKDMPDPVSDFKIEGRLLKDIVLELSKIYPIFDDIYIQQEFLNDGGIWYKFEKICKEKDLSTVKKLINYYVENSDSDERI